MKRHSNKANHNGRMGIFGFFVLGVLLLAGLAASSVNAQSDKRAASAEQSFRTAISTQMAEAAQRARVVLLPGVLAHAGGDGGFIVNAPVQGTDRLDPQAFARGADLLFVYVGANGFAVAEGYYKVRLTGRQAQFITDSGKVAATLPASVEQKTGVAQTTGARIKTIEVSAGWGKDGFEFDIVIVFGRMRTITVKIRLGPL